jgi:catechol 2,3-dioxygenase-like lactoylglutathione lyase family enzyme
MLMAVQALGYLGISTQNIDEWSDFAMRQVGLQLVDRTASSSAFRMDDRRQRIIVDRERPESERFFGWEVADAESLDSLGGKLEAAGVAVRREPASLADQRFVRALISFRDPAGNRLRRFTDHRWPQHLLRPAAASPDSEPARRAWDMWC